MKYAIFDIDGCCLDNSARISMLLSGDHKGFHDNWHLDIPIPQGVQMYAAIMKMPDVRTVFVTARTEKSRATTLFQLTSLFGALRMRESRLLMRSPADKRRDADLKLGLIADAGIPYNDIFICFDDRPCVIKAYRDQGWVAYQTAEGW